MKKFLFNLLIYFFLLLVVFFGYSIGSSYIVKNREFKFWQTESILLPLEKGKHYNIVFQGNSHARMFARYGSYKIVDSILGVSCYNLGRQGGRTGLNEHLFYLMYVLQFMDFDTLIFTISSPMLYSNHSNESVLTFWEEPVDLDFVAKYIPYENTINKWKRLFFYFRTKFRLSWLTYKPEESKPVFKHLKGYDSIAVKKGLQLAFPYGIDTNAFIQNAATVEKIIKTAKAHNVYVIFITTPTFFGEWPHHQGVVKLMEYYSKKYGIEYYDFTNVISDPKYFLDHHHLNTLGVKYFTAKYLKPALRNKSSK